MKQMLRLRYAMEKVYALDHKLKHQVDRLLKLSEAGTDIKEIEASLLKPNLAALLDDEDEDNDDEMQEDSEDESNVKSSGVYRPPKLTSTPYPEDEKKRAKDEKRLEKQKKKLQSSELYETLQEEFGTAPEESASGGIANISGDLKRLEQEEKDRIAFEEERFVRMVSIAIELF
jgi:hypothetical protein